MGSRVRVFVEAIISRAHSEYALLGDHFVKTLALWIHLTQNKEHGIFRVISLYMTDTHRIGTAICGFPLLNLKDYVETVSADFTYILVILLLKTLRSTHPLLSFQKRNEVNFSVQVFMGHDSRTMNIDEDDDPAPIFSICKEGGQA